MDFRLDVNQPAARLSCILLSMAFIFMLSPSKIWQNQLL